MDGVTDKDLSSSVPSTRDTRIANMETGIEDQEFFKRRQTERAKPLIDLKTPWREMINVDIPDKPVGKSTLVNTLKFAARQGDITHEYAHRKINELESEGKRHGVYGVLKRACDYVAGFFR